jgi:hypothetical protein
MDQVSTAPPSRSRKHSSGNNSDNNSLAVDSIGNNSFGFNFDAEEAMMANDSQAADNAVAGLASIATTYNKEAQGELYYVMLCYLCCNEDNNNQTVDFYDEIFARSYS